MMRTPNVTSSSSAKEGDSPKSTALKGETIELGEEIISRAPDELDVIDGASNCDNSSNEVMLTREDDRT